MKKTKLICTLALILCGCATVPQTGNFVADGDQAPIAADAVQQLASLYAPAHTQFALRQATPDAFGKALVQSLRERGYQIIEYVEETTHANRANAAQQTPPADPPGTTALRYVFDAAGDDIYRLTLFVGNQTLSRPYTARGGVFTPTGAWSRKE